MHVVIQLAAITLTVLALAKLMPAVRVKSAGTAVVVAIVFSILNFFLAWLLRAVLVVPALLTLGLLFLFVPFIVNTILLWLTDKAIHAFEIRTTGALLISSAAITLVNGVVHVALHAQRAGLTSHGAVRWI